MPTLTSPSEISGKGKKMTETTGNQTATDAPAKARKPRVKLPELDLGSFGSVEIVAPAVTAQRRTTKAAKPRSAQQKAIDKLAQSAYDAWVKGGKKAAWQDRPAAHLVIPEAQLPSLRAAVYNACQFLGKRVRFGDVQINDGKADVVFTVTDKPAGSDETNEDNAK